MSFELTPDERALAEEIDARTGDLLAGTYYGPDGEPISHGTWVALFNRRDELRVLGKTEVGEAVVSTVWLGFDHNWGDGPPLIFETMIFGGPRNEDMWRWSTREAALAGHEQIVAALRPGEEPGRGH